MTKLRPIRIITRGVIDMATSAILREHEESYLYEGPLALADAASLQTITRSIEEISTAAKAGNIKIDKQLGEITEHTRKTDARVLDLEQKILTARPSGGAPPRTRFAIGDTVAKDPKIEQLLKREISQARFVVPADLKTICRSVLVEPGTSGTSPEFGFPFEPTYISATPIATPGRKLQVLQALPHMQIGGGSAILPKIQSVSDGSAVQEHQGSAKGESTLDVIAQVLPMGTVATFLSASRQLLDDVATLPQFLQRWLGYFVLRKFENLIIGGDGTLADAYITGLVNAGTPATTVATFNTDKIAQAIFEALPGYGYSADLIVMANTDYQAAISQRATTNQYVNANAAFNAAAPDKLWGVTVVTSPGMATGTAVVLDSQLVNVLDRAEIAFFIGWQNTQLVENLLTYLSEIRGSLSVGDAHAIAVVTLGEV